MKRILYSLALLSAPLLSANETPLVPFLSVAGQGKTSVKATLAEVRVGIEVESKTAVEAQKALASSLHPVLDALKKLDPEKLETGSLNIYPAYNEAKPSQIVGYRGVIEIVFSKDAAKAGELIDAALKAGANKLIDVSMKPSDSVTHDARIASLQKACRNAVEEANVVMKALKIESVGIREVEILSEANPGPIPIGFMRNMSAKAMAVDSTQLLDQEQIIHANVNVKFNIK